MGASRLLLWATLGLLVPACQRLNPAWCTSGARCAAGEVCDPASNICVRLEGGVRAEARPKDALATEQVRDLPPPDLPRPESAARDLRVESCAGAKDGWVCAGGGAWRCTEASTILRRKCPLGQCQAGHCEIPKSSPGCKRLQDCKTGLICTALLESGQPKLLCVAPVTGGTQSCTTGLDCASGLCTSKGQCYYACDVDADCPPKDHCNPVSVLVEGVQASLKSCEP